MYKGYSAIQCVSLNHDDSMTFLVMPASQNLSVCSSSARKTGILPSTPFLFDAEFVEVSFVADKLNGV